MVFYNRVSFVSFFFLKDSIVLLFGHNLYRKESRKINFLQSQIRKFWLGKAAINSFIAGMCEGRKDTKIPRCQIRWLKLYYIKVMLYSLVKVFVGQSLLLVLLFFGFNFRQSWFLSIIIFVICQGLSHSDLIKISLGSKI